MSVLERILEAKRKEVAAARKRRPLSQIRADAEAAPSPRGFARALRAPIAEEGGLQIIAEIKRASPSAGEIRSGIDPAALASLYAKNGAAAISVLTDGPFFSGSLEDLSTVRRSVDLPLLRKDFIIDGYQIFEARVHGADAILLIVTALSAGKLEDLSALASECGLDVLVEVHSEGEVETALRAGARMVGINNRNLTTFRVDLETTARLAPRIPSSLVRVSESGIIDRVALEAVGHTGVDAVLVGGALMRAQDPAVRLLEFTEAARAIGSVRREGLARDH